MRGGRREPGPDLQSILKQRAEAFPPAFCPVRASPPLSPTSGGKIPPPRRIPWRGRRRANRGSSETPGTPFGISDSENGFAGLSHCPNDIGLVGRKVDIFDFAKLPKVTLPRKVGGTTPKLGRLNVVIFDRADGEGHSPPNLTSKNPLMNRNVFEDSPNLDRVSLHLICAISHLSPPQI